MPDTMTVFVNAALNGRSYTTDWSTSGDNSGGSSPNVTPAKAGSLTARTDNDTGTATMSDAGHGINTGDKVDVYWTGGCRRNMTVGTVAGTSVPLDLGSGDNLPNTGTALTLKVPQTEGEWNIVGNDVTGISIKSPSYRGQVVLRASDGTELLARTILAGQSYIWSAASGETNPLAGVTVAKATFSHEDASGTQEMPLALLYN